MYPNQPNPHHSLQPGYLPHNGMAGPSIFPHPQPHQPQHSQNPPPQLPQNGSTQPTSGKHSLISSLSQQQQSLKNRRNPPTQTLHQPPHFHPPPQHLPQNSTIQPPNSQRLRNQPTNSETQPSPFQTQPIPFRRQDRDFQQSIQNVLPAKFTQTPEYDQPQRRGEPMIPNDNSYSGHPYIHDGPFHITNKDDSSLKHSLLEEDEEVDALTAALKTMDNAINSTRQRFKDNEQQYQNALTLAKRQQSKLEKSIIEAQTRITNLGGNLDNSNKIVEILQAENKILTSDKERLTNQVQRQKNIEEDLRAQIKTVIETKNSFEQRLSRCQKENKEKLSGLETVNKNQKTEMDSLQQQNKAKEQQIKKLQSENNELLVLRKDLKSLTDGQKKISDEKVALEEQVEDYKNKLINSSDELKNIKNQLNKETEKLNQVGSELETSRDNFKEEMQKKETKLNDLIQCNSKLTAEVTKFTAEVTKFTAEVTKLTDENRGLMEKETSSKLEIKTLTEAKDKAELEANKCQKTITTLNKKIQKRQDEIEKSKGAETDLELKVRRFKNIKENLETQLDGLKAGKEELHLEIEAANKSNAEQKEEYLKSISELQSKNESDKKSIESKLRDTEQKLNDLNTQLLTHVQTNVKLQQDLTKEKKEKSKCVSDMRNFTNNMEAEKTSLEKNLSKLKNQLEEKSEKNARLQIEIDSVNKTRTFLDSQITELNLEVGVQKEKIESYETNLRENEELLKKKQQEINNQKIVISNQQKFIKSSKGKISGLEKDATENAEKLGTMKKRLHEESKKKEQYKSQVKALYTRNRKCWAYLQKAKTQTTDDQNVIEKQQQTITTMEKRIRELDEKIGELTQYIKEIPIKIKRIERLQRRKKELDSKLGVLMNDRYANKDERGKLFNSVVELGEKIQAKEDELRELYAKMNREIGNTEQVTLYRNSLNEQVWKEEEDDNLDECQPQEEDFSQSFKDSTNKKFPVITIYNGSAPIEETADENVQNVCESLPMKRICEVLRSPEQCDGEDNQIDSENPPKKRICEGLAFLEETSKENNQMQGEYPPMKRKCVDEEYYPRDLDEPDKMD
ncbi:unnamed protein product [Orchesella dallaii]|uniref:Uncharacterized protein n=1 Tax=Orchesella dallaii TaxID=48710 RepID=A0ABP1RHY0_9HEXA